MFNSFNLFAKKINKPFRGNINELLKGNNPNDKINILLDLIKISADYWEKTKDFHGNLEESFWWKGCVLK